MPRAWARPAALLLAASLPLSCDEPGVAPAARRWPCPSGWTPAARGGCAPKAVRCADADTRDVACGRAPSEVRRRDDGGFDGPWPRDGAPGAPPAVAWEPDGVPADGWSPDVSWSSCPAGWTPSADGSCDPQLPATCPEGDAPLPGGRCTETHACPAGEYADPVPLPTDAVVLHVRAGAAVAGADGSRARPFPTLDGALARGAGPVWILVAAGTYDEPVVVRREAHIVGVCAGRVTMTGDAAAETPAVRVEGAAGALDLRGVTVAGGRHGVAASGGASASLRAVRVEDVTGPCVRAEGSATRLDLRDVVVRRCRPLADHTGGAGVFVGSGATATIARTHVADASWRGVAAYAGRVTLEDAVVRDVTMGYATTVTTASPWTAYALLASAGATFTARRVVVERSSNQGVTVAGAGASATLEDVRVSDVRRRGGEGVDQPEACVSVLEGAQLSATRLALLRCTDVGVRVVSGGRAALREALVREVARTDATGLRGGVGLLAVAGGALEGERVRVELATLAGVEASDAGAAVSLRGAIIRETRRNTALTGDPLGVGAIAVRGGRMALAETRVERCRVIGAGAFGPGSTLTVTRSLLRETAPNPTERLGAAGVTARDGAAVVVRQTRIADNYGVGFGVDDGVFPAGAAAPEGQPATLTLEDSVVARTTARTDALGEPFDFAGQAGTVARRSRATITRSVLADSARYGLTVLDAGSACELTDVVIRGTGREVAAAETRTTHALLARDGASVSARRLRLADNRVHLGVAVGHDDAQATLTDSVVRGTVSPGAPFGGQGLQVNHGGSLTLARTLVEGNAVAGVTAHLRGRLALRDSAIVDTRAGASPDSAGVAVGLLAATDSTVDARGLLVAGSGMVGVWASDRSQLTASDLLVWGVAAQPVGARRLFGHGLLAHTGARVAVERLAVVDVHGVGVGAVSESLDTSATSASSVTARDVYVRDVAPAEVRASEARGREASYGLHAAAGSAVTVERAVVERSDWGFFLSGGALSVREGVFAQLPRGLGCQNGSPASGPLRLDGVSAVEAGPLARDIELPVALLPSPPAP